RRAAADGIPLSPALRLSLPWPALALRRHRRLDDGAAGCGRRRAVPEALLFDPEEGDLRAAPRPQARARYTRQDRRASPDAAGDPPARLKGRPWGRAERERAARRSR